jgi:rhodanese-related sulfurtransferase
MMSHCKIILIAGLLMTGLWACSGKEPGKTSTEPFNETLVLLEYLEANGEIINSPDIPSFVEAEDVYQNLKVSNYLVIDVRKPEAFDEAHIENAVNVEPGDILDFFEQRIEPNAFEKIVLVCENSHLSGFVNSVLLTLGYRNVFTLRFGLSAWHSDIADHHWLAIRSSHLEGQLEITPHTRKAAGTLPEIHTGHTQAYQILRARAEEVLQVDMESMHRTLDQVMKEPEKYYLINYWPESLYAQGHLPGAVQYNPKQAFHSNRELNTLPVNEPIVIYCFTGQHSAFVTPILRMLGYDAYNMPYGANAFIYNTMYTTQPPTRAFTENHVRNFPLASPGETQQAPQAEITVQERTITVQGGC